MCAGRNDYTLDVKSKKNVPDACGASCVPLRLRILVLGCVCRAHGRICTLMNRQRAHKQGRTIYISHTNEVKKGCNVVLKTSRKTLWRENSKPTAVFRCHLLELVVAWPRYPLTGRVLGGALAASALLFISASCPALFIFPFRLNNADTFLLLFLIFA